MSKEITVTVHISPDCQPETIKALAEMMKLLVAQMEEKENSIPMVIEKEGTHELRVELCTCEFPTVRTEDLLYTDTPRCTTCGNPISPSKEIIRT